MKTKTSFCQTSKKQNPGLSVILSLALMAFGASSQEGFAQTHLSSLVIPKNGSYEALEDTLFVDELVMNDSSTMLLNKDSKKTFISAKRITIGTGCTIMGKGQKGTMGEKGKAIGTPKGVCQNGLNGLSGNSGSDGEDGKDLIIETDKIEITSSLEIHLNGGNGGDGGKGGNGSDGSKSFVHCTSHGGNGGEGGKGGNGGNGGTFSLKYLKGLTKNELCLRAILHNEGGYQGLGGDGGNGGFAGHGSSEDRSKRGVKGKNGLVGKKGKDGTPLFYSIHPPA
jgi:hypothetical protein